MTTNDAPLPNGRQAVTPTADDVFGASEPIQEAEDLARNGIFDDGEVEHSSRTSTPCAVRTSPEKCAASSSTPMSPR